MPRSKMPVGDPLDEVMKKYISHRDMKRVRRLGEDYTTEMETLFEIQKKLLADERDQDNPGKKYQH